MRQLSLYEAFAINQLPPRPAAALAAAPAACFAAETQRIADPATMATATAAAVAAAAACATPL